MNAFINPDTYLAILNGLVGDKLEQNKDTWAIKLSFRLNGKDISVGELDKNIKGKRVVLLLHGLMADERVWNRFRIKQRDLVPVSIRYNTGRHISENGKELSQLLQEFSQRIQPKKIYLVGHSMGGLVLRSACYYGMQDKLPWIKLLKSVFLLAVPNDGAALEKLSHLTSFALRKIARWHLGTIGNVLEQRSNGIKDLRLGAMLDEDWTSPSAGLLGKPDRASVSPIPGVDYHILIGTLAKDETSLLAKYFGDGLVTKQSAAGETLLKISTIKTFANTGHNAILVNPEVHQYILERIKA